MAIKTETTIDESLPACIAGNANGEVARGRYPKPASRLGPPSRNVIWLSSLVGMLAAAASAVGLFSRGGPGPFTATTLRGETAQMFGQGIYRYDTLFQAPIFKGADAVVLMVGIPLLVLSLVLYRRGSLRGRLLLLATLTYFLYDYASVALGAAYNNLFLVYITLFSASLLAALLVSRSLDPQVLAAHFSSRLPRRAPAIFMFVAGVVTAAIWLSDILGTLVQGQTPRHLDVYSTMVTYVLDLGIIAPASVLTGFLLLRRSALGYLLAFPLLGIIVLLAPTIVAQTVSQVVVGVGLTPGEVFGPVVGFMSLGLVAVWLLVNLLRNVTESPVLEAPLS